MRPMTGVLAAATVKDEALTSKQVVSVVQSEGLMAKALQRPARSVSQSPWYSRTGYSVEK